LVDDLFAYSLDDLAVRAINGEFDAGSKEAGDWANSLEGMETFDNPAVVATARLALMAIHEKQGIPWDEAEWQKLVKLHRP
jgi:hypothetical protein